MTTPTEPAEQGKPQPKSTVSQLIDEAKSNYTWQLVTAEHNFQWNVWRLREQKGWSQHELARRMGVAQPWVARHMAGYTPSLDSLAKYAHVFGVTIAELVGEPMHFPPYLMHRWSDEAGDWVQFGTYTMESDAHTITTEAKWEGII